MAAGCPCGRNFHREPCRVIVYTSQPERKMAEIEALTRVLDATKEKLGLSSDRELSEYLDVDPTMVNKWRSFKVKPSNARIAQLVRLSGLQPEARWVFDVMGDLQDNEVAKRDYMRLGRSVGAILLALLATSMPFLQAEAKTPVNTGSFATSVYYVNWRMALRRIRAVLRSLAPALSPSPA